MASKLARLTSGNKIPLLGIGTWKSKPGEVGAAVETAIDAGYRHIDCAYIYGNEAEIGAALKKKFDEGLVKRADLFITSKLWNTKHKAEDVLPSVEKSIADLQIGYLDLYLIHWPIGLQSGADNFPKNADESLQYSDDDYVDTWPAMEKCVDEGLIKSIGLSNFNSKQIARVKAIAKIQPSALQVECHPYLNQSDLIKYCKENGVHFTAYSPLGSKDRPWAKAGEPALLEDTKLMEIGKRHGKSPAQVCIRWQIQRGLSVIPKSANPARIKENFDVFGDFNLSDEDMNTIDGFNKPWRACLPKIVVDGEEVARDAHHLHYPFSEAF